MTAVKPQVVSNEAQRRGPVDARSEEIRFHGLEAAFRRRSWGQGARLDSVGSADAGTSSVPASGKVGAGFKDGRAQLGA